MRVGNDFPFIAKLIVAILKAILEIIGNENDDQAQSKKGA